MAVFLVGVYRSMDARMTQGTQIVLGGDLAPQLHPPSSTQVRGAHLYLDGGFGGAVAHEHIAVAILPARALTTLSSAQAFSAAAIRAGSPVYSFRKGGFLADHIQLGVVVIAPSCR